MTCKPGELAAIPFPYSNLTARKRRPVLVLTDPDARGDFSGLAVTSVHTREFAVGIDNESLTEGRLPKPSWVRYDSASRGDASQEATSLRKVIDTWQKSSVALHLSMEQLFTPLEKYEKE